MNGADSSERALAAHLLGHYGVPVEVLPFAFGPREALAFPVRCADLARRACPGGRRALDLGCTVGRSSFELCRQFGEVVALDPSERFIRTARYLQAEGCLSYRRADEGEIGTPLVARIDPAIDRRRVTFGVADPDRLPAVPGPFDCVLAANLLERCRDPQALLDRCFDLVSAGGVLVLTSTYAWADGPAPTSNWLGGFCSNGAEVYGARTVRAVLSSGFTPCSEGEMPLLVREHARGYRWMVAHAMVWRRHGFSGGFRGLSVAGR